MRLGLVIGFGLPFLYFAPAATMWFYNLSRSRRADVLGSSAAEKLRGSYLPFSPHDHPGNR